MTLIPQYDPEKFRAIGKNGSGDFETKGLNDFFIVELSVQKNQLQTPFLPHRLTVNDFVFVSKGELIKTVCSDSYSISESTLMILPPYKIRTMETFSDDIEGYYCHFPDELLSRDTGFKNLMEILNYLDLRNDHRIPVPVQVKENILFLLERMKELYKQNEISLLSSYLQTFLAEIKAIIQELPPIVLNANETTAFHFRKKVTQHINTVHSIREYAEMLNVSPNHLNKSVKMAVGKTASAIISETLTMEAKSLLSNTDLSIADIAFSLGIEDPSYFARFFKKHTGNSPNQYRKRIDLSC
ncbi:helix-turn-helix domain-containing protein [Chryseobacterium populi]|uniref:DNA-binding domain-containing protein, AraC-type n=1 Tax=Chryseobacterium populi TaxID=1144316 RepID=J2K219_9FLAO|nr:helix-turn-helix domain-containing protein [Chryseobacterium populi]EJL74185.1 DNA-binding domain-containing protein, AraC-type [Chryseobacterium populi]